MKTNKHLLRTLTLVLALLAAGNTSAWAQGTSATFPVEVTFQGSMNSSYFYMINSGLHNPYNAMVQNTTSAVQFDDQAFAIGSADVPITMTVAGHFTFPATTGDATVHSSAAQFTFSSGLKYITGISVSTYSGTPVSFDIKETTNFSRRIGLLGGTTFGKFTLTMATHTPLDYGATIGGIEATYLDDGVNRPVPTVTYKETSSSPAITLTEGEDYTVSYSVGSTSGTVTITGMGQYIGSTSKRYNIRQLQLSDFTQLSDGSYEIATKQDLDNLAKFVSNGNNCSGVTFRQTADIAYTSNCTWDYIGTATLHDNANFTPIGGFGKPFKGTYDGGGHTISGIRIYTGAGSNNDDQSVGLFGFVSDGTVKNVVLRDANILADHDFAGIVGYLSGGTVTGCTLYHVRLATGRTSFSNQNIVVGNHASGTVSGNYYRDCIRSHSTSSATYIERCNNVFTVTTAANTTATYQSGANVTIDGVKYYAEGSTFTLGYSGNTPGANVVFSATAGSIDGSILTMPAEDVTVSVTITSCSLTLTQGTKDGVTAYWGTFYSGTYRYALPEGAAAYTMGTDYKLYRLGTDGRVIPDGKAVVILATEATPVVPATNPATTTITLTVDGGSTTITDHSTGGNQLHGSDSPVTVTAGKVPVPGSNPAATGTPYTLSLSGSAIGFYKFTGGSIPAGKAYYVVTP